MSDEKKSNGNIVHRVFAVALDVVVVVAFVLGGAREHNSDFGFGDVLIIGLPFIAAFFAIMLVVAKDLRSVKSAIIASVISIPIAFWIRINLPRLVGREEYSFKPIFVIVAFVFLTFFWVGWRIILSKLRPGTSTEA